MLANAIKEKDGVLVCHDNREAARVSKEYGVRAISLGDKACGMGPVVAVYDNPAVLSLYKKIDNLKRENKELKGNESRLQHENEELKKDLEPSPEKDVATIIRMIENGDAWKIRELLGATRR